jgi:hypothetical protein
MRVTLPNVLAINVKKHGNTIQQIGERGISVEGDLQNFRAGRIKGLVFRPNNGDEEVLIVPSSKMLNDHAKVVHATLDGTDQSIDFSSGTWLRHPILSSSRTFDHPWEIKSVLESWTDSFSYKE